MCSFAAMAVSFEWLCAQQSFGAERLFYFEETTFELSVQKQFQPKVFSTLCFRFEVALWNFKQLYSCRGKFLEL